MAAPAVIARPSAARPAERLSATDSIMWRIESNPVLRSPILVVGLLDRPVDIADVRATLAGWVERFPRFRQRAEIGSALTGGSRWVDDEHFSLDHHVRRVEAPAPADLSALLELAAPDATEPFDPARAPWNLTLVDGIEGSHAGFLLRFHHTISDGVGAVQLASALFGDGDEPRSLEGIAGGEEVQPGGAALPARVLGLARQVGRLGALGATAALDPMGAARGSVRFGRSMLKALAPVPAPLSPVFTRRGLDRRLGIVERPLDDLRAVAKTLGCTVNDVFLAAVGGALHEYHRVLGHQVPALRFTMPISLRREGDAAGGNHFAPARFVLPIDDPDPTVRAQIAGRIARGWRREPALARTSDLAMLLDLLPDAAVSRLFGDMLEKIDVDAVDVPGLEEVPTFAGAALTRMWAFAPPTGAALSVTLLSHAGTACIALNTDVDAVPEPDMLRLCLEEALDEVIALAGSEEER